MACKHIFKVRRFSLYILIALLFVSMSVTAGLAAPPPDPYADAVHSSTSGLIISPGNALGAPDGNLATVVGVLGQNLVLDMGEGEEGTSDLIVYYGPLGAGVVASIQFLDDDQQVIYNASLLLSANVGGAQVQVTYPNAPTPYRFVRFTSVLSAYTIDAVQAVTYRPDSDNDGLPDAWEIQYGLDPLDPAGDHGAAGDPDNDGLTNLQEWTAGTHPNNPDTDGDGLPDGWEVNNNTNPTNSDSDNDGLTDGWEVQYALNPLDPAGDNGAAGDPDNDGLTNQQEWTAGTHPNNPDTDGDSLPDDWEVNNNTNPTNSDSDNDGLTDGWEVQYALDPLDPAGDNGAAGDPDNDGRTNLEEYLTGTNPVDFDGALFLPLVLRE